MATRKLYNSVLHLDYETRSRIDLFDCGAFIYAADRSTQIICLGWAFDDEDPQIWIPDMKFPKRVLEHINGGYYRSLYAHNAQFERLITRHVLPQHIEFTQPPLEAWNCTAAQARERNLPAALADLGTCLLSMRESKPV